HGCGVSTFCAAAVAEATCGLDMDMHIPNVGTFAAATSVTTPAAVPAEVWAPDAANVAGVVPNEHCSAAPVHTRLPIAHLQRFHRFAFGPHVIWSIEFMAANVYEAFEDDTSGLLLKRVQRFKCRLGKVSECAFFENKVVPAFAEAVDLEASAVALVLVAPAERVDFVDSGEELTRVRDVGALDGDGVRSLVTPNRSAIAGDYLKVAAADSVDHGHRAFF